VVSFARKVNGVPKAFEKNSNDKSFLPCNLNGNEKKDTIAKEQTKSSENKVF
jgi:hypothetical protein